MATNAKMSTVEKETFSAIRKRKEVALAELRQLEVAQRRGELIPADEALTEWATACTVARDRLLGLADRLAAQLEGKPELEIRKMLREEVSDALRSLSVG